MENSLEKQVVSFSQGPAWKRAYKKAAELFKQNPQDVDSIIEQVSKEENLDPIELKEKLTKKGVFRDEQILDTPEPEMNRDNFTYVDDDAGETTIGSIVGPGSGEARATKRPIRLIKRNEGAGQNQKLWAFTTDLYRSPVDWTWVAQTYGGGNYLIEEMYADGTWHVIKDGTGHEMMPVSIAKSLKEQQPIQASVSQSVKEQFDIIGSMGSAVKNILETSALAAKPSADLESFKFQFMEKAHEREMSMQEKNAQLQANMNAEILKRYDERLSEISKEKKGGLMDSIKEITAARDVIGSMFGLSSANPTPPVEENKFWNFAKSLTNNPIFAEKIGEGINGLLGGVGLLLAGFASKVGNNAPAKPAEQAPPAEQKQVEQPKQVAPQVPAKQDDLVVQKHHMMLQEINVLLQSKRLTYDQYLWFMEGMEVPMFYPNQIGKLDELITQLIVSIKSKNQAQYESIGLSMKSVFLNDFDFSPAFKNDKGEFNEQGEIFFNKFVQHAIQGGEVEPEGTEQTQ